MNIKSAVNKKSIVGYEYIEIVVCDELIHVPKESDNATYQEILRQVEAKTLTIEDE